MADRVLELRAYEDGLVRDALEVLAARHIAASTLDDHLAHLSYRLASSSNHRIGFTDLGEVGQECDDVAEEL